MIHELDLVVLNHDMPDENLKMGDVGTVVHSYTDGKAFEVEFLTAKGKTVALLTLNEKAIRPIYHREILHVRALAA